MQPGDTMEIAGGTYTESGLTIDRSLTLEGEGNVVIAAPPNISPLGAEHLYAQPGLSIIDQPDRVAIKNVSLKDFQASLSDTGGGTLDLVDVNMLGGDAAISNLDSLDVVSDSSMPRTVVIDIVRYAQPFGYAPAAAPPASAPDNLWIEGMSPIDFSGVKNLLFATGAGSHDTISVSPLPDTTVTIDGDDSTPPGAPGNTLQLPTNFYPGSSLTATKDATGISGTWTPGSAQPVSFRHIASLLPGIATQNVPPITGAQGADSGNQVVAKFKDLAADAPAAGDTAEIYWGDNSKSAGTITYDATTGVYSVLGSHAYSQGGSYSIEVSLKTLSGIVLLPDASATITDNTVPHLIPGRFWTLMPRVGESTGSQGIVTFGDGVHLPPSDYSAEIDWGDGTSSTGTISYDPGTWTFEVSGTHVYTQTGVDQILVTVARNGVTAGTLTATASVSDQPLEDTPATLTGTAGVALGGASGTRVATFEEQQSDTANFQATIDWGDGATTSGTVVEKGDLSPPVVNRINWQVDGSHTYAQPGNYVVRVSLIEYGSVVSAIDSTAAITAAPNPSAPNQAFITSIYHNLLNRAADSAGMAYWSAQLDAGFARSRFITDIESSNEYRNDEVQSLYEQYLHRSADPAALAADSRLLAHGMTNEQLATIIISSDEYYSLQGGTLDGFLNALFQDTLGRPIDAIAKNTLEDNRAAGMTRAQLAAIIFGSHEYHADVVKNIYLDLLDRPADAPGDAYWANQLDGGATDEHVMAVIAASNEYSDQTS
ncbi:MAG TPA: DUF4214 domain-containing protein [Pirellulales bacterium]|nr:DUF4214 domain-containing protein [Pirellulales bacterium]